MKKEELRKVEYTEMGDKDFRNLSPLERTKAAAQHQKKQGYFHGWATDTALQEDVSGGLPQLMHTTRALIEQADGIIIKIKPENIRFVQ